MLFGAEVLKGIIQSCFIFRNFSWIFFLFESKNNFLMFKELHMISWKWKSFNYTLWFQFLASVFLVFKLLVSQNFFFWFSFKSRLLTHHFFHYSQKAIRQVSRRESKVTTQRKEGRKDKEVKEEVEKEQNRAALRQRLRRAKTSARRQHNNRNARGRRHQRHRR